MKTATGPARFRRAGLLAAVLATVAATSSGDLLPNELPSEVALSVAARAAAGSYVKPFEPALLRLAVHNPGEPLEAAVRVQRPSGDGLTSFGPARQVKLEREANTLEVLFIPGIGTHSLKLLITETSSGRAVFRGDLSRFLKALEPDTKLILLVGAHGMELSQQTSAHIVIDALQPQELPHKCEAYAAAGAVIIGDLERTQLTAAQRSALVGYLRGGGLVVFASFRTLSAFEDILFKEALPRTWADWPGKRTPAVRERNLPERAELRFGLGKLVVFAAEPGELSGHSSPLITAISELLAEQFRPQVMDRAVMEHLIPSRPFEAASSRGRTAALAGGLLVGACVPFLLRAKRKLTLTVLATGPLALAAMLIAVWGGPAGAARLVRVRYFTADGRAEAVTDVAVILPLRPNRLSVESEIAPLLPMQRDEKAFELLEDGKTWRVLFDCERPNTVVGFRSRTAVEPSIEGPTLVTDAILHGHRARLRRLPGGASRWEDLTGELPADLRKLAELVAPSPAEICWMWSKGVPQGLRAPGLDPAGGSGTLVLVERAQ